MKTRNASEIIDRIKAEKKRRGFTNPQLAEASGVSPGTLNKIFGAETKDPSIGTILKIVAALDVPENCIFGEPDEADDPSDLTADEQHLLDLFRQLTPKEQGNIIGRAELLVEQHEEAVREDTG